MPAQDDFAEAADITYRGRMAGQEAAMQGIEKMGDTQVDIAKFKYEQQQKQQQQQKTFAMIQQLMGNPKSRQKMQQTAQAMKATGALTQQVTPLSDEEYNQQASDLIKTMSNAQAQKMGAEGMSVVGSGSPSDIRAKFSALFKASGIPEPQPKVTPVMDLDKLGPTIMPQEETSDSDNEGSDNSNIGWNYNVSKDELTIHGKETSPEQDSMAQAMKALTLEQKKQVMEKSQNDEFTAVDKSVNPANAPTRSALGVLGNTSIRADRAIDLLNDPKVTTSNQVMSAVTADISGILQGGAPTIQAMGEQNYNTLASSWAKFQQFATAHPNDAIPQDIKDQLNETLSSLKDTCKSYIKNNLDVWDNSPFAQKNPDTWAKMKEKIKDKYIRFKKDDGDDDSDGSVSSTLGAAGIIAKPSLQDSYAKIKAMGL